MEWAVFLFTALPVHISRLASARTRASTPSWRYAWFEPCRCYSPVFVCHGDLFRPVVDTCFIWQTVVMVSLATAVPAMLAAAIAACLAFKHERIDS
jgi:hypothetical protein